VTELYLYGITRPRRLPKRLSDKGIRLVRLGGLAAIVSPVDASPVEASRRNLLAHADVVEELHAGGTVLPARFGIVLSGREELCNDVLGAGRDELERMLEAHRDTAELSVKASYDESVLAEVAGGLDRLRDSYARSPTLENGMALGEAVAEALAHRRDRDADLILGTLRPLALDVRLAEPVGAHGLVNLAFLVERETVETFSARLDELGARLSPPARFKLIGPLPPYSFVDLETRVAA
jgi:gas vesicle protein GvpL/GvpF